MPIEQQSRPSFVSVLIKDIYTEKTKAMVCFLCERTSRTAYPLGLCA
jgi:hypothetical protein